MLDKRPWERLGIKFKPKNKFNQSTSSNRSNSVNNNTIQQSNSVNNNTVQQSNQKSARTYHHGQTQRNLYQAPSISSIIDPISNPIDNPISNSMNNPISNSMDNSISNPISNSMDNPMSNPISNSMDNSISNPISNCNSANNHNDSYTTISSTGGIITVNPNYGKSPSHRSQISGFPVMIDGAVYYF